MNETCALGIDPDSQGFVCAHVTGSAPVVGTGWKVDQVIGRKVIHPEPGV